jgi:hypothetical protein
LSFLNSPFISSFIFLLSLSLFLHFLPSSLSLSPSSSLA